MEQKELTNRLCMHTADCHSFSQLDSDTRDAIIDNISATLCISNTEAEDIAECLYYEPVEEYDDIYLHYRIPNFLIRKCLYG